MSRPSSKILDAAQLQVRAEANKAALTSAKNAAKVANEVLKQAAKNQKDMVAAHKRAATELMKIHASQKKNVEATVSIATKVADKTNALVAKLTPAKAVKAATASAVATLQ